MRNLLPLLQLTGAKIGSQKSFLRSRFLSLKDKGWSHTPMEISFHYTRKLIQMPKTQNQTHKRSNRGCAPTGPTLAKLTQKKSMKLEFQEWSLILQNSGTQSYKHQEKTNSSSKHGISMLLACQTVKMSQTTSLKRKSAATLPAPTLRSLNIQRLKSKI